MNASFLKTLGLTKYQQNIYMFLLENGESIASLISKKLNIPRASTYSAIEGLEKKRLVDKFIMRNITFYQATSPKQIVNMCKENVRIEENKQREAEEMVKELQHLEKKRTQSIQEIGSNIKYYKGKDSIKKVIEELIKETAKSNSKKHYYFGNGYFKDGRWTTEELSYYREMRIKHNIQSKTIIGLDNSETMEPHKEQLLRETKYLPHSLISDDTEVTFTRESLIIYYKEEDKIVAIKIDNKRVAKIFMDLFKVAWHTSKDYESAKKEKKFTKLEDIKQREV